MARRRYLQPGFWKNPLLSKLPPLTRLFFQVTWTFADFDGCFPWDPEALAMKGLPRDSFDPGQALDQLEQAGFLRSYEADGQRFGYIVNWHKHQDPHPGESPVYPKPQGDPDFIVKVKVPKWRKEGIDTASNAPWIETGCQPLVQLASKLPAGCTQLASKLPANF